MARKRSTSQTTASAAQEKRKGAHYLPDDWQQHLNQPGDSNFLGVSIVFRQFADPMLAGTTNLEEFESACKIAMIAWNLALLMPHQRLKFIGPVLQAMPIENQIQTQQYISNLIARKEQQFGQYNWFIGDFHVEESSTGIRLVVAAKVLNSSTMPTI